MQKILKSIFLIFAFTPQALYSQTTAEGQRSPEVKQLQEVVVHKGFILSRAMYHQTQCQKVWENPIEEFKKHNPHIKDPDKIKIGDRIKLPVCSEWKFSLANKCEPPPKKKKRKKKLAPKPVPVVIEQPVVKEVIKEVTIIKEVEKLPELDTDITLMWSLGFLMEQDEKVQPDLGFRVKANINPKVGYNLRINAAPTVIMAHNELAFKTVPDSKGKRYYFAYGLGIRAGTKENNDIELSNNSSGYTTIAIGSEFRIGQGFFDVQVGSNASNYFSPFISVLATKRLGDSPFTLGGYADYRSTMSSKEDSNLDRRWIGGGMIFTY